VEPVVSDPHDELAAVPDIISSHLPAQVAMLILADTEATGVAYCSTRRELWRAEWPTEPTA
jgi:hypothetical protein